MVWDRQRVHWLQGSVGLVSPCLQGEALRAVSNEGAELLDQAPDIP